MILTNRWRRLAASLVLVGLIEPPACGEENPLGSLEFLYIDANTGGSSGGHTAIKLDDTVYHFQNDEGYTRLARENWQRFRFIYNDVDNRNIHSATIALRTEDLQRIRDHLSLRFLTQNRQVDYLAALQRDEAFLAAQESGTPVDIAGVGFFSQRPHEANTQKEIRADIEQANSPGFIHEDLQRLNRQLQNLAYFSPTNVASLRLDNYPDYAPTYSEQIEDIYAHWFALTAIELGWPLRDGILIDVGPLEPDSGNSLNGRPDHSVQPNRAWLTRYREQLAEAIEGMLAKPYPGSGAPLLLSLARHQAISLSLTSGRFLLLDILANPSQKDRQPLEDEERILLRGLIGKLQKNVRTLIAEGFRRPEPDESIYHRLEVAAAESKEAESGLAQGRTPHFIHSEGPPRGLGHALLPKTMTIASIRDARKIAAGSAEQFLELMQATYQYQLVTHNCVTELARAVNSSFEQDDETQALGGHLAPGEDQGFIPFRFFELIRQHYRVSGIETLPSRRNRHLAELSAGGSDWGVLARESNTLTSNIYRPRAGDSAFLIFTEHAFWSRPLLGALNLGYAMAASSVGLFTAPADEGALIKEGLFGVLFSMPELGLWNIRKGSFSEMYSE